MKSKASSKESYAAEEEGDPDATDIFMARLDEIENGTPAVREAEAERDRLAALVDVSGPCREFMETDAFRRCTVQADRIDAIKRQERDRLLSPAWNLDHEGREPGPSLTADAAA